MSRTADVTLSGWVMETKIEDKAEFLQLYYDKGPLGFYIYVLLRNIICGQYGYYAVLNNSLINSIHCKLGRWTKPVKFIKELIEYFGEVGILDKSLLKDNILTSVDIQKSWLVAKKAQRTVLKNVDLEHWLLVDTLPTDTSNNTGNNNDYSCSKNVNTCYKNTDICTQDTTRELVYKKTNNNLLEGESSSNGEEKFTKEKVLAMLYAKHERFKDILSHQEYSEHAILYAEYWANACNDERYMTFTEGDKIMVNSDFYINCLYQITANEALRAFQECYSRQKDIRQSTEWYFRGILVHQHTKLAKKLANKYQRGEK